jgi:hypothetical protein
MLPTPKNIPASPLPRLSPCHPATLSSFHLHHQNGRYRPKVVKIGQTVALCGQTVAKCGQTVYKNGRKVYKNGSENSRSKPPNPCFSRAFALLLS